MELGEHRMRSLTAPVQVSANAESASNQVLPVIVGSGNTIQIPVTINVSQTDVTLQREESIYQLKSLHQKMLLKSCSHLHDYGSHPEAIKPSTSTHFTEPWMTKGEMGPAVHEHDMIEAESAARQWDEVYKCKTVQLTGIFQTFPQESYAPRVIVTKGIAGIGKTACIQWLLYNWATGNCLSQYDFVFPLPFRELSLLPDGQKYTLIDLLNHYYPHLNFEKLLSSSPKLLLIFDGLDECQLMLNFSSCSECRSVSEPITPTSHIINLVRGNLLPAASIWITSRPVAVNCIPLSHVDIVTEIQGFLDCHKETYFCKRLGKNGLQVISHLKKYTALYAMCYIPAFCWLLATIFEHSPLLMQEKYMPQSLTEIYTNFLLVAVAYQHHRSNGKRRSMNDANALLRVNKAVIRNLARMAYYGLKSNKLVFFEQDLNNYHLNIPEICEGLIREFVVEDYGPFCKKAYAFVHLTIQEYLAALFVIISCSSPKQAITLALQPNYCFGNSNYPSLFVAFKEFCQEAIKSPNGHLDFFLRFLCGLGRESNHDLVQGLLETPEDNSEVASLMADYIGKLLKKNVSPERCLNLLHCLSELKANSLADEIKNSMATGALSFGTLSLAEYSALAFVLQTSGGSLEKFVLNQYIAAPDGVKRLSPVAKLHRKLCRFEKSTLNEETGNCVKYILSSYKSQVKEIRFRILNVKDSGWMKLCEALASPHCKVETVMIRNCRLKAHHYEELGKILVQNHHITELDLCYNDGGDEGVKLLSIGLLGNSCNIRTLRVNKNSLTDQCCQDLAVIVYSSQSLTELYLHANKLGDSGIKLLCTGLRNDKCQLEKLSLFQCGLTSNCCADLAETLYTMRNLKKLALRGNKLQNNGVRQLCGPLQRPDCTIQHLGLEGCGLFYECCEDLATVLEMNKSLKSLSLDWNELGDTGGRLLSRGLLSPTCILQNLELEGCGLTEECCHDLALALSSNKSLLSLNLSENELEDNGVTLLCAGLKHPNCQLQRLILQNNGLTGSCCKDLKQSLGAHSHLTLLDLSKNYLNDLSIADLQEAATRCPHHCTIELRWNKFSSQGSIKLKAMENQRDGLKVVLNT
ncbi:NACHT, LRR and PYD domains-containing protein 12-like isoform X1 [Erpetoichthys calabaricus]|uniref:NACHT, LRR and PYD domains-containing protein 12-like isoform X1 n=1 Tax=Erpetoichthys calabaricus TaxID=27687 RepID=UPI00109EEEBE|nr:NACHT, LRR and PYD domains-containing protein 12-like isoform X1 [Erpetoichthys calabaricus]